MKKRVILLLTLAVTWGVSAVAQTFEMEVKQEKLMYRQFRADLHQKQPEVALHQASILDREMRQVKRDYENFVFADSHRRITEVEEMRLLKRDYRNFMSEKRRQNALAANITRQP